MIENKLLNNKLLLLKSYIPVVDKNIAADYATIRNYPAGR